MLNPQLHAGDSPGVQAAPAVVASDPPEVVLWIGQRLRSIRQQKQLSLAEVDRLSEGDFCPSTIGAYERGSRSISISRLRQLASFYGVSIQQLLPSPQESTRISARPSPLDQPLTIDTLKLSWLDGPTFQTLGRYIALIQQQRHDRNPNLITLRGTDAMFIAAVFAVPVNEVLTRLAALDLLYLATDEAAHW